MISQPFNRFKKRDKPRRKRPELPEFAHKAPKPEPWKKISLRVRVAWWIDKGMKGTLLCGICGKVIRSFAELVPDHIVPGKMGGCKDHSESNLQPAHYVCNSEKASNRNYVSPRRKSEPGQVSGGL